MALEPGGVVAWLLVGLVAGFLTDYIWGRGHGLVGAIVLGAGGGFLGGLLAGALGLHGIAAFWGTLGFGFIGAVMFLAMLRVLAPARRLWAKPARWPGR